jgi:hypothetical protein
MNTPKLSKAVKDGELSTIQLLEIAASEIPPGSDLRDLLLGTANLLSKMKIQLATAVAEKMEND